MMVLMVMVMVIPVDAWKSYLSPMLRDSSDASV
jgi:hypothetical protein